MKRLLLTIVALVGMTRAANAGVYTTTYTTADGRVVTCTTITDLNGNPLTVNCIGG